MIERANELYASNMFLELERYLKIEIGKRPKNIELKKILVNTLLRLDKVAYAIRELVELSKLDPLDMEIKLKLAECYATLKRYKQAIKLCEDVFRYDSKNVGVSKYLADLYYTTRQNRTALQAYQTYLSLETNPEEAKAIQPTLAKLYYETGNYQKALECFDDIQADKPDDVETLQIRMDLSQKLQHWDKCLEICKKIISLKGETIQLLEKVAQMYFNMSNWEEAFEYYTKLTAPGNENSPNYVHCQNRVAEIHISKGNCDGAVELLTSMIEKYPGESSLVFTLAHAYVAMGNYESAVDLYQNLSFSLPPDQLKLVKKHTSNLVALWADTLFEKGDYSRSFDKYVLALKHDDENPEAYYKFGVSNLKIKNFNDAIAHFKRAITLNQGEAKYYYALGCANDEMGNHKAAQVDFESALELDKENPKYMNALGALLSKQFSDIERGIELFMRVVQKNPRDPDARYNMALAYEMIENKDEAIKHYKTVLDIMPEHVEAQHNLNLLLGYEYSAHAPRA
ncbi:hypothetical protein tpqmel_0681 [Candidatus Gastranaerophilus sp. (ex Termes propinquus)]|nr:hypothetical protein tpqmel_0681 [Candidatus Gastranaerophilus sp. (ex Termes propinquus)]